MSEFSSELVHVIVKRGDDLRQDALTCQGLSEMERMWRCDGLRDILLTPYRVVSTGYMTGMIEAVVGAETVASLTGSAAAALGLRGGDLGGLAAYLKRWNPSAEEYEAAIGRFRGSCAGYCVATYVLGVGDRHGDNVMLARDGRLFHVDFGHFLGNFKTKFGVRRETAPFALTSDFARVMGGPRSYSWIQFVQLSCRAYNSLRSRSRVLLTLFEMMLGAGLPNLNAPGDLAYMKEALAVGLSDAEAAERFTRLIHESLGTTRTRINNALHMLARG